MTVLNRCDCTSVRHYSIGVQTNSGTHEVTSEEQVSYIQASVMTIAALIVAAGRVFGWGIFWLLCETYQPEGELSGWT